MKHMNTQFEVQPVDNVAFFFIKQSSTYPHNPVTDHPRHQLEPYPYKLHQCSILSAFIFLKQFLMHVWLRFLFSKTQTKHTFTLKYNISFLNISTISLSISLYILVLNVNILVTWRTMWATNIITSCPY